MKTTEEIGTDYIKQRNNENRMKKNQKWYSEEEIQEKINSLINFLDIKQKENFIYKLTTDELYCFFLNKLDKLKEKFGDE